MATRTYHQRQARFRAGRRAAVLLIVLTLLVLFVLIGVTFVLVSTRYRSTAADFAKTEGQGDPPRKLFEEVLTQILVGPRSPNSSLWQHDLLGDLYGKDGVVATVQGSALAPNTGGQFMQISLNAPLIGNMSGEPGEYAGRVLTITAGPNVGVSTRIVGSSGNTVTVETPRSDTNQPIFALAANTTQVVINGGMFNGTGAGYQSNGSGGYQRAMSTDNNLELALMPHFARQVNDWTRILQFANNEGYDAVDYQNMFMAKNTPDGIIPSYHRPDLINFWMNRQGSQWSDPTFRARVMFRPDQGIHPAFTGSNPAFNPLTGPWDVDNDGDGIPDSIWVDIGLPVRTAANGQLYKPLVAIMIQDLDGRFDLNSHGNLAQVFAGGSFAQGQQAYYAGGGGLSNPNLRRGIGTGPAGIDFRHIVSNYGAVLTGRYKDLNYGAEPTQAPGFPGVPGNPGNDPASYLKDMGVPRNYYGGVAGVYGSPSDVWDQGTVGVDVSGHPIYQVACSGDETSDDPYDFNPHMSAAGVQAKDNPYTVAELEALLRRNDADAYKLPQRLLNLIGTGAARFVTVRTSGMPTNAGNLPAAKRGGGGENHLHALFERAGITDPTQLVQLMPTEVLKGGKMNLNRRMGNGVDDNGNGAIDDSGEGNEMAWAPGLIPGYSSPQTNYLNYGPVNGSDPPAVQRMNRLLAKQAYARQLYMLAMLLSDPVALPTTQVFQYPNEYKARRIAQWAVNCVDFSDPDAIMTPFEYDADLTGSNGGTPGWQQNIDGNPQTDEGGDRRIVWGCEFPDLLMTEVTAFHDKRAKDTALDSRSKKLSDKDGNMMQVDTDLDQWRIPSGSVFVELYCPRAPRAVAGTPGGNPALPRELYSDGQNLNLGLTSPNGDPVWRICLSRPHNGLNSAYQLAAQYPEAVQFQPEAMVIPNLGLPVTPLQTERYVFFTPAPPGGNDLSMNVPYSYISYYRRAGNAVVSPGGYAVIGPRATTILGVNRDGTDTTLATTAAQRIILGGTQITVNDASGTSNVRNNVQTLVCAMDGTPGFPLSGMNVSEPLPKWIENDMAYPQSFLNRPYGSFQYPAEQPPSKTLYADAGERDGYADPAVPSDPMNPVYVPDKPFDYQQGRPLFQNNMMASGTYQNHRTAFLQRLADPTMPFDQMANPYITIDWKPIDLTVFNGEDRPELPPHNALPAGFVYDNNDNNPSWSTPPSFGAPGSTGTRQSGDAQYNIWNQFAQPPTLSVAAGTAIFNYSLKNTFGGLNYPMIPNAALSGAPFPYNTAPQQPFPWIKIPNRPFISAYEIMQVPASAPNRLMQEFTLGNLGGDPYNGVDIANFRAPYAHLLNFFRTSPAVTSSNPPSGALNLHRIFDYVEVPSRYVGTETWYNADAFGNAPAGGPAEFYRPPFNYMSKYQDPGQVNINTIFDNVVWDGGNGMSGVCGGRRPDWNTLKLSRQGYPSGSDAQYPSQFSNPFRPGWMADIVPLDVQAVPEIDVTLLRRAPGQPTPLFADPQSGNQYDDAFRHSHFRYEPLVAIGNKVKFTSNVYAVWMTVGFFQVQSNPAGPTPQIPDGFQLGPELGVDTGEITRHRAFYMLDRSIPVGYQPGEANNSERCVLLRRYLE